MIIVADKRIKTQIGWQEVTIAKIIAYFDGYQHRFLYWDGVSSSPEGEPTWKLLPPKVAEEISPYLKPAKSRFEGLPTWEVV